MIKKESIASSSSKAQKLCTAFIYIVGCKRLCDCFKYLLKRNQFLRTRTKCRKQILKFIKNRTLKSTGEIKLRIVFYLSLLNFSEFWIYFLEFPWEIVFGIFVGNCYYLYLLLNAKTEDCNMLIVILWHLFLPDR